MHKGPEAGRGLLCAQGKSPPFSGKAQPHKWNNSIEEMERQSLRQGRRLPQESWRGRTDTCIFWVRELSAILSSFGDVFCRITETRSRGKEGKSWPFPWLFPPSQSLREGEIRDFVHVQACTHTPWAPATPHTAELLTYRGHLRPEVRYSLYCAPDFEMCLF